MYEVEEYLDRILKGKRPVRIRYLWIAKKLRMSYSQVRYAISKLEKMGLIEKFYGRGKDLPGGKIERELWIRKAFN